MLPLHLPDHLAQKSAHLTVAHLLAHASAGTHAERLEAVVVVLGEDRVVVFVIIRQPALRVEIERVVEETRIAADSEITDLTYDLFTGLLEARETIELYAKLTPFGTYTPATVAPGLFRGIPVIVVTCARSVS